MRSNLISFVVIFTFLISPIASASLRPLQRFRKQQLKVESIFDNATIEKSSAKMTLHLSDRTVSLLTVPDVMQATDYTCGPSSLSAVLAYYQYDDWR